MPPSRIAAYFVMMLPEARVDATGVFELSRRHASSYHAVFL